MSNRIVIEPTKFIGTKSGYESIGIRVYDSMTQAYDNSWDEIPDDDMFVIKYDKIVTMTEVKEGSKINFYKRYLDNEDVDIELDGKVNISDKMGYISTVEDARKKLERIFKDLN